MKFPCIALLTDFGDRDGFVGVMKGVILSHIQDSVNLTDISHCVERQNIRQAAWILENSFQYFPEQTVFVAVVDPAVGSESQIPLLCYWPERRQIFIAPDNGLLTGIFEAADSALQVFNLRNAPFYKNTTTSRSRTFHGRDVYAPIAALTSNAIQGGEAKLAAFLAELGVPLTGMVRLKHRPPQQTSTPEGLEFSGEIVYVDTYGNLITNIPSIWLPDVQILRICLADKTHAEVKRCDAYTEGAPNNPIILPSSGGTLEISLNKGDARRFFDSKPGDSLTLYTSPRQNMIE